MSVNLLTEEQAKLIAVDCSNQVLQAFMDRFFPNLLSSHAPVEKDILFTKKQLAEYWQCHEQTITQKKLKGQLPFIQHGRKLLFSKNAIDKLTTVSLEKRKGAVI